ncbi:MAG: hypothetical protein IPO16_14800 [Saprospiraceae bacterium]|nr:hypothetical protein [Saprospiraceae bacterium]
MINEFILSTKLKAAIGLLSVYFILLSTDNYSVKPELSDPIKTKTDTVRIAKVDSTIIRMRETLTNAKRAVYELKQEAKKH